jgi:hypothetical protein
MVVAYHPQQTYEKAKTMLSVRNLRLVWREGASSVELIGFLLLAWVARCDDSRGAAVPIEVSPVRVFPERGKCVGLAGFQVNASSSWRCTSIALWSRAYRQDMLPGGQHRIVSLTNPQIRNLYTVDKQDQVLESPKIGCPRNNQTSIIFRTGRGRVRSCHSRLNGCACSKAAGDGNRD